MNKGSERSCLVAWFILSAKAIHQGLHMVCIQTRVPSLSKITNFGLKNLDFKLASHETVAYFLKLIFPLKPLLTLKIFLGFVVVILALACKIVIKQPKIRHFLKLTSCKYYIWYYEWCLTSNIGSWHHIVYLWCLILEF